MATIAFDATFGEAERVILSKTFKQNCRDLSIQKDDFSVQVRRASFSKNPRHYARVVQPDKHLFLVELNSEKFNLFDATSSLGHETVHMRQQWRGDMYDHRDGIVWKGKLFPLYVTESREFYNSLPWEKEAWALQPKLHINAMRALNHDERQLCHPRHSNGLFRLWGELEKEAA